MGRTKPDSIELPEDVMPADSNVARTVLKVDGEEQPIFRRNVAYGTVPDHGTAFVGSGRDQWLEEMLRRMVGAGDGIRCALTRYVRIADRRLLPRVRGRGADPLRAPGQGMSL